MQLLYTNIKACLFFNVKDVLTYSFFNLNKISNIIELRLILKKRGIPPSLHDKEKKFGYFSPFRLSLAYTFIYATVLRYCRNKMFIVADRLKNLI